MKSSSKWVQSPRLVLEADTASDFMSENPISLSKDASVHEAIALLTDRNFDAAPVIDENGRPVGVVTVTDILVHDREYVRFLKTSDVTARSDFDRLDGEFSDDFGLEIVDRTCVQEIMTPNVFTISADAPASEVVHKLLSLQIHHLFVADSDGILIGVISTCDILRRLAV